MLSLTGADWLLDEVGDLTDHIDHITPVDFNEANRFLPESVTSMPGFIRYDVNPYMREILNCFDVDSPVREVALMKGVQITFSTLLESGALYYMGHIKTVPMMYITADRDLAKARIENNFLPMLQQSGFSNIIRSSDEGNTRKTGKTANHLQWAGGGYMVPFGAINANKMRSFSMMILLRDEVDGWPDVVGRDGDPIALTAARCSGYWDRRKIFDGSTPLLDHNSKIKKRYLRGDQRKYFVPCKRCGFEQFLRWEGVNKDTGKPFGIAWETENDRLISESVRYLCQNCGEPHFEHDKEALFAAGRWNPTATPVSPEIRSYHLPGLYSPAGFYPWSAAVTQYLDGFDPKERRVKDMAQYQVFYNNVLGETFEVRGAKITFTAVSAHRRPEYIAGQIPNKFATEYAGSPALFLTLQVDVHKSFLAVAVMAWARDAKPFVVDYWSADSRDDRFKDSDCTLPESPVWGELRDLIEKGEYTADDGRAYRISEGITFIDAGYANERVVNFCEEYAAGVYPVLGRERPAKSQRIKEFAEFETQSGTRGYRILVDHYKDRLGPVLRREWSRDSGPQKRYHFNAPQNISDKQIKELTAEKRMEKIDANGHKSYYWHRPSGVRNELWDLLVYGHAAVEVLAVAICRETWGLDSVDWARFWDFMEARLPPCKD